MDPEVMQSSKAVPLVNINEETPNHEVKEDTPNDEVKEDTPNNGPDEDFFYMLLDYDSDDEEELREEFRKYHEDIVKYEGFLVEHLPSVRFFGATVPLKVDGYYRNYIKETTQFAIDNHNSENNDDLELVEIKRCNVKHSGSFFYYITFDARHSSSPEQKEPYQTEVRELMGGPLPGEEKITVKLFRPERLARCYLEANLEAQKCAPCDGKSGSKDMAV